MENNDPEDRFDFLSCLQTQSVGNLFLSQSSFVASSTENAGNGLAISSSVSSGERAESAESSNTTVLPDIANLAKIVESLGLYSIDQLKQCLVVLGIDSTPSHYSNVLELRHNMLSGIVQELKTNYELFLMMLTVKDLKKILSDNNMKVSGKKEELVDRLVEAVGLLSTTSPLTSIGGVVKSKKQQQQQQQLLTEQSLLHNRVPIQKTTTNSSKGNLITVLNNVSGILSNPSSSSSFPSLPVSNNNNNSNPSGLPSKLSFLDHQSQLHLATTSVLLSKPSSSSARIDSFEELDLAAQFGFVDDVVSVNSSTIKRKRSNSPFLSRHNLSSHNSNRNTTLEPRKSIIPSGKELEDAFEYLNNTDESRQEDQGQAKTEHPVNPVAHEEEPHFYYDYSDTELNEILRTLEQNIQRDYDRKLASAARRRDIEKQSGIMQYREFAKQISVSPSDLLNDTYSNEIMELTKKCEEYISKVNATYEQEKNDLLTKQTEEIAQLNIHFAKFGMLQGHTAVAKINSMKGLIKAKEEQLYERELQLTLEFEKLHLEKQNLENEKRFLQQFENETTRFDEIS